MREIKAWLFEEGDPIPDWLEKCEPDIALSAGARLIISEDGNGGFEVRFRDYVDDDAYMMRGNAAGQNVAITAGGTGVHLCVPDLVLRTQIRHLKDELDDLKRQMGRRDLEYSDTNMLALARAAANEGISRSSFAQCAEAMIDEALEGVKD